VNNPTIVRPSGCVTGLELGPTGWTSYPLISFLSMSELAHHNRRDLWTREALEFAECLRRQPREITCYMYKTRFTVDRGSARAAGGARGGGEGAAGAPHYPADVYLTHSVADAEKMLAQQAKRHGEWQLSGPQEP